MSELYLLPHSRPEIKWHVEPEKRLDSDWPYPTDTESRVAGAAGRAGDVPGTAAMGTAELGIFN